MGDLFQGQDVPVSERPNRLFYGDNLTIMRDMPTASVDLIYLDPPFNSQRNYNLIYKQLTGQPVPEQEEAFCDAWQMDPEKEEMVRKMPVVLKDYGADDELVAFWDAWIAALRHTQPRLLAYLVYMSFRLFEMRRILKSSGSLYLHCDPTASHYIKVILDGVFGHRNFRNEIAWCYKSRPQPKRYFGKKHDTLLFYSASDNYTFNWEAVARPMADVTVAKYRHIDEDGRHYRLQGRGITGSPIRSAKDVDPKWEKTNPELVVRDYLDEKVGVALEDWWVDINILNQSATERLGYPTQKPIALLDRLIQASSNPGDVVFDPFCGCGTAVYAAHLAGRKWIGCDVAILSVQIVRDVLLKWYGLKDGEHYKIDGVPLSVEGARDLLERDSRQFQHWAVELSGGFASTKHSGDRGVDGRIHYETPDGLRNMVLSVKGGKLQPAFMRELRGVLEREHHSEMAGLICLQKPTKGMIQECAGAGIYRYKGRDYHRLQIRTIEDLLDGTMFDTPARVETLGWTNQMALPLERR